MLFDLPFSTYDEVRDLGYEAGLYCASCHRKVASISPTLGSLAKPSLAARHRPMF